MKSRFEKAHKARFGFIDRGKQLVVEAVSVEAVGGGAKFRERKHKTTRRSSPRPPQRRNSSPTAKWHKAAVYTREQLSPGHKVKGPAIVIEPHQTIVLEDGWRAEITAKNHLVLKRVVALQRTKAVGTKADPIMLEVFNNLFMSIAEQMGVSLQNTAYSVNIKERLDFSCAVFSADGSLVANAPHMPVHLGSMDRAVETIIRENKGKIRPGDFLPDQRALQRRHPHSRSHRLHAGVRQRQEQDAVLGGEPRPSRRHRRHRARLDVADRHLDRGGRHLHRQLQAGRSRQIPRSGAVRPAHQGANIRRATRCRTSTTSRRRSPPTKRACRSCTRWSALFGLNVVHAYMKHVQDNADESVRRVIERLHDSEFSYEADQGNVVKVKITVDKKKREATVDFTGTSPQQGTNFNAPEPVTRAAVLYVFRVMVDDDIPMNAGCLRPINIIVPDNSMLRPHYPAAVVAGNVEVSQMVTDTLLGALGAMAGAQGTMNNVNFGNDTYQYYETICSGSPAGPGIPRHRRRAHPHDQHPADRSGDSGIPLSGACWRTSTSAKAPAARANGMPATASAAPCVSWRRWNTPSCPATAASDRSAWPAARTARSARTGSAGTTARWSGCKGADATVVDAGEAIIIQTPTAGGYGKP